MSKVTDGQDKALRRRKKRLLHSFKLAQQRQSNPGVGRTWMHDYLAVVLGEFLWMRRKRVDGLRLSDLLGSSRRMRIAKLLSFSSNRDLKTRGRWGSMLRNALKAKVPPSKLANWLAAGGGIAGRARPVRKNRRRYKRPDSRS
jgi:hypothetical protein